MNEDDDLCDSQERLVSVESNKSYLFDFRWRLLLWWGR